MKIIEERMKELSERISKYQEEVSRDEALNLFDELGEHYKSEIIKDILIQSFEFISSRKFC